MKRWETPTYIRVLVGRDPGLFLKLWDPLRAFLLWEATLGMSSPTPRRASPAGGDGHLQLLCCVARGGGGARSWSLLGCL